MATVEPKSHASAEKVLFSESAESQGLPHLHLFMSGHSQSSVNEGPTTISPVVFTTEVIFPSLSLLLSVPFCRIIH